MLFVIMNLIRSSSIWSKDARPILDTIPIDGWFDEMTGKVIEF